MERFMNGKVISTTTGVPVTVIEYLGGSGKGEMYLVDFMGERKVFTWYDSKIYLHYNSFYDNLKRNAENGSPHKAFLWPIDVTEKTEEGFGCIYDRIPKGYINLADILADRCSFSSFGAAVDACIQITLAFYTLHSRGCCYEDIHEGIFMINPDTGDVRICCTDGIILSGTESYSMIKPRYAAPEILLSDWKTGPNYQSERLSLATFVFMIIFKNHPLEGRRWIVPCLTEDMAKVLYGTNPVFVFDSEDESNRPDERFQENLIYCWNFIPSYLKEMFKKAFSKQALKNPNFRLREFELLSTLVRFRSGIIRCSCGNDVFVDGGGVFECNNCQKNIEMKNAITLPKYSIGAIKGTCVYRCQLGYCSMDNALKPVLLVVSNDEGVLGIKNMMNTPMKAIAPNGEEKCLDSNKIVRFIPGITFFAHDTQIKLT